MPNILITGKGSFIGSNFIISSKFKNIKEISLKDVKAQDIDFSDVEVVLHVAAIVHQNKKISEDEFYKVNRDLCLQVAKCAKNGGVKQFVFLSTVKVYGAYIPEKGIWNENSLCEPEDLYGKSKYEAEIGLRELEDKDFIASIIRPPLVYGVGVKANMLNIIKLVNKFKILPLGKIRNKRSFVAVENLIELIDIVPEFFYLWMKNLCQRLN